MLKTKQVGKYTVTEMGPLEQTRMRLYLRNAEKRMTHPVTKERIDDPELEETLQNWAGAACCVTPSIDFDEWMQTSLSVIVPILEAVEEVNADMLGRKDNPALTKKKPRSRPQKSTPN